MRYLDFMKIVFHTFLLGCEKELSIVPQSPASMEAASTASSVQSPDCFCCQKELLQKILHFS
jgi:hypothetical protein